MPQVAIRGVFALLLVAAGCWGMLAIWFQSPTPDDTRSLLASAYIVTMCLAAGSVMLKSKRRFTVPAAYVAFLSVISWWTTVQPSEYRDWSPEVARRAVIQVAKDEIEVKNVRRFEWRGARIVRPNWEHRVYRLADLDNVDILVARDGASPMSHSLASFGFSDGRRLALSVDIRTERHEAFQWIAGLFRQYELTLTAADEADILRQHGEALHQDLYRYRLDISAQQARDLFAKYTQFARDLEREPRFYNSLTSKTASAPFAMLRVLGEAALPSAFDRVFTADTPETLFASGRIAHAATFSETEAAAKIVSPASLELEEPSLNIANRQGWSFADAPRQRTTNE